MKKREFLAGDLALRKAVGNAWDVSARKLARTGKGHTGLLSLLGRSVLFRGYGGESTSSAMECSKFEEVLLLAIGNVLIWVVYNLLCK